MPRRHRRRPRTRHLLDERPDHGEYEAPRLPVGLGQERHEADQFGVRLGAAIVAGSALVGDAEKDVRRHLQGAGQADELPLSHPDHPKRAA